MKLASIAAKDVLLLLKDRRALLTLLGTPLLLTFILGMAFAAMWGGDSPPSLVLWMNHDPGGYGDILFDEVFTMEGIKEWALLEEATDREAAVEHVRDGQATAFLEIPPDFSRDLLAGQAVITVIGNPSSSIRAGIITQIVRRFASELSSRVVINSTLASLGLSASPPEVESAILASTLKPRITDGFQRQDQEGLPVPMDYYAAGMGVLYLLFTVSHGGSSFLKEREDHTLARMYQAPVKPWQIGAGKLSGIFIMALLQLTAVILISRLVFGVVWGQPLGVALITVTAAFAASGLGILIAAFSRSHSGASALGTAVVLPMSVIGGSMMPLFALPELVRSLSKLTPNGWAMDGYTRLMFEGAGPADLVTHGLVLLAMGLTLMVIAGAQLSRKGVI